MTVLKRFLYALFWYLSEVTILVFVTFWNLFQEKIEMKDLETASYFNVNITFTAFTNLSVQHNHYALFCGNATTLSGWNRLKVLFWSACCLSDGRRKPSCSVDSKFPNYPIKKFKVLSFFRPTFKHNLYTYFQEKEIKNQEKIKISTEDKKQEKRWERNFLPSFFPQDLFSLCIVAVFVNTKSKLQMQQRDVNVNFRSTVPYRSQVPCRPGTAVWLQTYILATVKTLETDKNQRREWCIVVMYHKHISFSHRDWSLPEFPVSNCLLTVPRYIMA